MISMDGILGVAFLFQTGLGVMGNAVLFVGYAHIFTVSIRQRPTCLIIIHLSLVHMLLVCTIGIPEEAAALGFRIFMDDIVCKTNAYLHRVSRGLSICLTSLLSILQAFSISPRSSYWAAFKIRNPLCIIYAFFFIWILNLLISSNLIISISALQNESLSRVIVKSCFILGMDELIRWFFLMFMALRDVSFMGSMCWSSGYMIHHLYRHHKQIQHLHRSSTNFKKSPEMRATEKIIILTLCFIFFYGLDMIVSFHLGYFSKKEPAFLNAKKFVGVSFALLSPVVLLSNDTNVHRFWTSALKKSRNQSQKDEIQKSKGYYKGINDIPMMRYWSIN